MKIAFIGLGNMGSGIAACIQKAGFDLTVWNRTAAKADTLVAAGAKLAATAREAVANAEIVITCLMDDQSILDMMTGETGVLSAMKPGAVHLCVTTISPVCADSLAKLHREHGTRYLSGPVVGRPDAAAAGQLTTYLAGDADTVALVEPICASYARMVIDISERPPVANSMKLCVNYFAVSLLELMGEIYAFAERSGVPTEEVNDFFHHAFAAPVLKMYATKIRTRDFDGAKGFAMTAGLKDVTLMQSAHERLGVPFEIGAIIRNKMQAGLADGMTDRDWSAIYEVTRRQAGLA